MDFELKLKWIAALRSGQYEQGRNVLHQEFDNKSKWCCLGVLGHIMGGRPVASGMVFDTPDGNGLHAQAYLPMLIAHEAGLNKPHIEDQHTLSGMNDSERKSFSEIACYIEANL